MNLLALSVKLFEDFQNSGKMPWELVKEIATKNSRKKILKNCEGIPRERGGRIFGWSQKKKISRENPGEISRENSKIAKVFSYNFPLEVLQKFPTKVLEEFPTEFSEECQTNLQKCMAEVLIELSSKLPEHYQAELQG